MYRRCVLSCAVISAMYAPVFAQTSESVELQTITVSASRESSPLNKLANNVSVLTEKDRQRLFAQDLETALESVAGVSFDGNGRYGATDVSIRGISGNRVKILVDGQQLADGFEFGPYQNSGRDYATLHNIRQLEVIKGPASSLHGSDAIGGVVSLVSKTPNDFLKENQKMAGDISVQYKGDRQGINTLATLAVAPNARVNGLVSVLAGKQGERRNHHGNQAEGAARSSPDPQTIHQLDLQTQWHFQPNAQHRLSLSAGTYHNWRDTNQLSARGEGGFGRYLYQDYRGKDRQQRWFVNARHEFEIKQGWADSGYWRAHWQGQYTKQDTRIQGALKNAPQTAIARQRESEFMVEEWGVEAQFNKAFASKWAQDWLYGVQFQQKSVAMNRRIADKLSAGAEKVYDQKNAPDSVVRQLGIFAQNRVSVGESGLSLIGGLRYDHYQLQAQVDETYRRTVGTAFKVRDIDEGRFSFRLGALWDIHDHHALYANYAEGFRAPAFHESNLGFENRQGGYVLIPNFNLRPESSYGIEAGWRSDNGIFQHDASVFYTYYKDFIDNNAFIGDNPDGISQFQAINLPATEIYGAELTAGLDFGGVSEKLQGISGNLSLAYAEGRARDSGKALSSLDPLSGQFSIAYDAPNADWGVMGKVNFATEKRLESAQSASVVTRETASIVPVAGYAVVDLTAYYQPVKGLTLRAGVFNLFDKEYITWRDARWLSALSRQRYSASGRWIGASLRYEF